MIINQILAKSTNNVIGKDNDLPWHLPKDFKFFKSKTLGYPVIMGRKTYESMGKPLPGRTNIIITTNKDYQVEGCVILYSIEEAIEYAKQLPFKQIFIIGGSTIFEQSLKYVDKIFVTEVKAEVEGNIFYNFDETNWDLVWTEEHQKNL